MKAKDALHILGVSRITLYNYLKSGKIKAIKLPNGYYDYNEQDIFKFIKKDNRVNVIYARVSTYKQKKDLGRQINFIKKYCKKNKVKIDYIASDISSGINLDRPNFSKLLNDVLQYKVSKIYISHRDRLSRLSYKMLELIFCKFHTEVIVINDPNKSNDAEYYQDLLSLMHYFSTKIYSNRRKTYKTYIKK